MADQQQYDVAFSFLSQDELAAKQIADALASRWRVFVYSDEQKRLAFRDGIDAFNRIFRTLARACVILHRLGWGTTRWTAIEETAIKSRAFETNWDFLMVVSLDGSAAPEWIPRPKLWLGFAEYGMQGAIGAIDSRLQELGGTPRVETLVQKAARLARETDARAERDAIVAGPRGVAMANDQVAALYAELRQRVEEIAGINSALDIRFMQPPPDRTRCAVTTRRASLSFAWVNRYGNTLDKSQLVVAQHGGRFGYGLAGGPPLLTTTLLSFALDDFGNGGWRDGEMNPIESNSRLVERLIGSLLDHAHSDA